LSRLNRIVALKGLGFTLQQVQSILDDEVSVEELRGMLLLRQAEHLPVEPAGGVKIAHCKQHVVHTQNAHRAILASRSPRREDHGACS
jgi:DNA-binding transcriptional MerR regulator